MQANHVHAVVTHRPFARSETNRNSRKAAAGRAVGGPARERRIATLFAKAIGLQQSGQFDQALRRYARILKLNPDLPEVHYNRGVAFGLTGQFEAAEDAYRRAIALDPDLPEGHNNLGELMRCLGRLDEAEVLLRRAIALRQPYAEAFSNLGNTLKDKGRLPEAEVAYREAIAQNPLLVAPYNNLGVTLLQLGRLDESQSVLDHAIGLKPDFAEAHHNAGLTLKHAGRLAAARQFIEHAITLAPQNTAFFLSLGELKSFAAGDGHLAAMEELARNADALSPHQQIDLHFALGKAHEDVGQYDSAFRHLLAGNALKRRQLGYDEAATLGLMDHTRNVFSEDLIRGTADAGDPSPVPTFVIGMPRAGSTLIEQILASHPQVHGAGERTDLADMAAAIRTPAGQIFPDAVAHLSRDELRELGARYLATMVRLAPDAKCIVDKTLSNFLYAGLIHLILPHARIIHAVRDAADTCVSCFSKQFSTGLPQTYDLAELGRYYRHYHALMQHWRRVLPQGRILEVRYEDVVGDLEGQARRIVAHCGLDWNARCLSFHETERPVFTASSVQVRKPLYRHAVGRAQPYRSFLGPLLAELPPRDG